MTYDFDDVEGYCDFVLFKCDDSEIAWFMYDGVI